MNRIKALREAREIKQIDLAEKLNISQGTLSNWERGVHDPDNETLLQLADFFNVSIDYLLLKSSSINVKRSKNVSKRYLNETLVAQALRNCLRDLFPYELSPLGDKLIDWSGNPNEKRLMELSRKTEIEIERINGFVSVIKGDGSEMDFPSIIELRKMMLVNNCYTQATKELYNRLKDEEELLDSLYVYNNHVLAAHKEGAQWTAEHDRDVAREKRKIQEDNMNASQKEQE